MQRLSTSALHAKTSRFETVDESDHQEAREWLSQFRPDQFPSSIYHVTFSRSSGPGGQNVNKVNSKATLRIDSKELLSRIPKLLQQGLLESRYYSTKSESLLIQAEASRDQSSNIKECYDKFQAMLLEIGAKSVKGETSQASLKKVRSLQKASNESRLRGKRTHSSKKNGRRSPSGDY